MAKSDRGGKRRKRADLTYHKAHKLLHYGDEYETVTQIDNIKIVRMKLPGNPTAPIATRTKGRVYATLDRDGDIKFLTYYNSNGSIRVNIDVKGVPHTENGIKYEVPHAHIGNIHKKEGYIRYLTPEEEADLAKAQKALYNYRNSNN